MLENIDSGTLEVYSDIASIISCCIFRRNPLAFPIAGLSLAKFYYDGKRIDDGKEPILTTIESKMSKYLERKFQNVDLSKYNLINALRSLKRRGKKS